MPNGGYPPIHMEPHKAAWKTTSVSKAPPARMHVCGAEGRYHRLGQTWSGVSIPARQRLESGNGLGDRDAFSLNFILEERGSTSFWGTQPFESSHLGGLLKNVLSRLGNAGPCSLSKVTSKKSGSPKHSAPGSV